MCVDIFRVREDNFACCYWKPNTRNYLTCIIRSQSWYRSLTRSFLIFLQRIKNIVRDISINLSPTTTTKIMVMRQNTINTVCSGKS